MTKHGSITDVRWKYMQFIVWLWFHDQTALPNRWPMGQIRANNIRDPKL